MVRVVSAHHFLSQGIQTCDVPYAATTAPPDRLLLALSHQVEVRDLSSDSEVKFTFPTVDQSHFLAYCAAGNYVASVERKVTRQGSQASYVRLYTGWEGGDTTAMRARIAGCVTPATSHIPSDSSLEIIELPLRFPNTSHIACCQVTGNIVVVCEKYISLYQLVFRTHDISRLKFLDFEPWPVTLELSFAPSRLVLAEDVVAASDKLCLHVFRINKGFARPSDWSSSGSPLSTKGRIIYGAGKKNKESKVMEEFRGPIPVDDLLREVSDVTSSPKYVSKLGNSGLPVLAMLPSIKCSLAHNPARNLRTSPFKPPHSVTMGIAVKETPANEPWAEQMTTMVESLLQLELGPTEGDSQGEMFTSVHLRPVYISTATPPSPHTTVQLTPRRYMAQSEANFTSKNSCPRLRSTGYNDIVAFSCFITTMQEGFLYHFPVEDGEVMSLGRCISTYNFTSNVKFACVEPYLIHVLTSSGLETYTMRTANIIHHENTEHEACPSPSEPVCLLGLRPFLGVVNFMLSQSHLVVLSSSDDDKSQINGGELTVYSLKLPSGAGLYADMLSVGETHRYTMRSVYSQLLNEAHSVLCAITRFSTKPRTPPDPRLVHLYKESCALLADYHLSCNSEEDHELGFKYAFMAELKPTQVMERLKKIEAQTKQVEGSSGYSWGLFYYLKRCLCERLSEESWLPPPVLNTLLDLVDGAPQPFILPHLILISPILRQFSTERSVRIIQSHINQSGSVENDDDNSVSTSDYLALAVLYVMRSKQSEAAQSLEAIPSPQDGFNQTFVDTLVTYWQIIFDPITQVLSGAEWDWEGITFSDISVLLMDKKPVEFAMALSTLVCDSSSLQLEHILQVFLTYLPSSVGSSNSCSAGYVLQKFLESVFSNWKLRNSNWKPEDNVDNEALKILMRSYLSDLVTKGDKYPTNNGLGEPFNVTRPKFLQLIPPLSVPDTKYHPSLINLQCLLCTGWLDDSSKSELVEFVSEYVPQQLRLSLFILAQSNKAVDLLISHSPLAVPLYTREMVKGETELKDVVLALQTKIEQEEDPTTYKQVLSELLEELARTLPCEELLKVVPPGEDYSDYILTCQRMAHANHIRSVIMATGQKLLQTLNL